MKIYQDLQTYLQSLGRVTRKPVYDRDTQRVYMIYDHGEPCNKVQGKTITTKIIFICEKGPSKVSIYVHHHDHAYVIWASG